MKKILAVLLACAMFLPILASCGSLQAGELDVQAYAQEDVNYSNVGSETPIGYVPTSTFRTELQSAQKYRGSLKWSDFTWYLKESNTSEIATPVLDDSENTVSYTTTRTITVTRKDTSVTEDKLPVYTISDANQFMAFFQLRGKAIGGAFLSVTSTEKKTVDGVEYDNKVTTNYVVASDDTTTLHFINIKVKLGCDVIVNALKSGVTNVTKKGDLATNYGVPAAPSANNFQGVFDGCGHVISGIYFSCGNAGTRGIFGGLKGNAKLLNFSVINSLFITSSGTGKSQIGFLSTAATGTNALSNIYLDAYVTETSGIKVEKFGGFVGVVSGTVNFNNCVNAGTVNLPTSLKVGGFVGEVSGTVTFNSCKNESAVTAVDHIGGFVGNTGTTATLTFTSSENTGAITGTGDDVGGFVGYMSSSKALSFSHCKNVGEIKAEGKDYIGGFVGYRGGAGTTDVSWCENAGKVKGNSSIGGFLGTKQNTARITIQNSKNTAAINAAKNVGGFVGYMTQGPLTVEDCANENTVTATGNTVGGFIGQIGGSRANTITIKTSNNTGNIKGASCVGGLFGNRVGQCNMTVTSFVNSGNISATSSVAGGIIGRLTYSDTKATNTITTSSNTGTITSAGSYAAGIIADVIGTFTHIDGETPYTTYFEDSKYAEMYTEGAVTVQGGTLTIKNTVNSGNISAGVVNGNVKDSSGYFAGGILGYAHADGETYSITKKKDGTKLETPISLAVTSYFSNISVTGCTNSGNITSNRCAGGIVGYMQRTDTMTIDGCTMTGEMNVRLSSNGNTNAGGILARIHEGTLYFMNNTFSGAMTVTFADAIENNGKYNAAYAGGLIGQLYSQTAVYMSYCTVSGDLTFVNQDTVADTKDKNEGNIFVGTASKKVNAYSGMSFDASNSTVTSTGFAKPAAFSSTAAGINPESLIAGYQTRPTKDNPNTYDLRFVATTNATHEAAGFVVTMKYKDGENVVHESMQTVYAGNVYEIVKDENGYEYKAADYTYDYLYTLVITGIPVDYSFEKENLEIQVIPFGAVKDAETDKITYYNGSGRMFGTDLNHTATNKSFNVTDFHKSFGDLGYGEDDIVTSFLSTEYKSNPSLNPSNQTMTYGGVQIQHNYPNMNDPFNKLPQERELSFLSYTFTVEEAGKYDIVLRMRENEGNSDRRAYLLFNAESGADVYYIQYEYDEKAAVPEGEPAWADRQDAQENTYVTLLQDVELKAGKNTLTVKIDTSIGATWHFREYFVVKSAAN